MNGKTIHKSNLKTGRRIDRRWKPTPRNKLEQIGLPTGLFDRNGNEIKSGDMVRLNLHYTYKGIVLYHRDIGKYGLFYGFWYGENQYDSDCYGKFIPIPKDNGMRMEIEILHSDWRKYRWNS